MMVLSKISLSMSVYWDKTTDFMSMKWRISHYESFYRFYYLCIKVCHVTVFGNVRTCRSY